MTFTQANDAKLIQDVENLKIQYPQAKDLYREVCNLMFFRYGIQPTANKLYQLVRKGTMTAPSQAVNNFWSELRNKRRVDIEHPGLPDSLREFAGEALNTLWNGALEVAKQHYQSIQLEAKGLEHNKRHEIEQYQSQIKTLESAYAKQQTELQTARKQLQEIEKRMLLDSQILATQKESVQTLQNEKLTLETSLRSLNSQFANEVNRLNGALKLADDRYRKLETKAMMDVDRERHRAIKLEIEIAELKKALIKEHSVTKTQTAKNQKLINELRENIGLIKGQLKESQRQQLVASNKLKQIERKKQLLE